MRIKPWGLNHRTEKDAELANLKDREKIQNYELNKTLERTGLKKKDDEVRKEDGTVDKRFKKLPRWYHDYEEETKNVKKFCRHCDHALSDHSLEVSRYHDKCNIENCKCEYFLVKL